VQQKRAEFDGEVAAIMRRRRGI